MNGPSGRCRHSLQLALSWSPRHLNPFRAGATASQGVEDSQPREVKLPIAGKMPGYRARPPRRLPLTNTVPYESTENSPGPTIVMRILFLHGWQSTPGGLKPTYLKDHGHEVPRSRPARGEMRNVPGGKPFPWKVCWRPTAGWKSPAVTRASTSCTPCGSQPLDNSLSGRLGDCSCLDSDERMPRIAPWWPRLRRLTFRPVVVV